MTGKDFSFEPEDEFFEDFSGWEITDTELEELLIHARETSDVRLRRLVKQTQYFRWLMPKLLEIAEQNSDESIIINLARGVVRNISDKNKTLES